MIFLGLILVLVQFACFHYLPPLLQDWYEFVFVAALALIGLVTNMATRSTLGMYRLDNIAKVLLLYTLAIVFASLSGGLDYRYNLGILALAVCLSGLLAHPLHSLAAMGLLILIEFSFLANTSLGILPGARVESEQINTEYLFSHLIPFGGIVLLQFIMMGFRQNGTSVTPGSFANDPSANLNTQNQKKQAGEATAPLPAAAQSSVIVQNKPEDEDPTATQFFTRSYLEKQEAQTLENMKGILNTVVYFMSRNFKAYTSLGLLATEMGDKLIINSVVTRSKEFDNDCVIEFNKGIVGGAVNKPGGFITGSLANYPDQLEYYKTPENINSVMIQRIIDTQSKRLLGLLVVDSDRVRAFTDEHKELLNRFTQIASAMITNARMTHQLNKQAAWADTQYEISKKLSEVLKPEDVIEVLTESLMKIFQHDRLVICVYNASSRRGNIWNIIGDSTALKVGQEFDIHNRRSLYGSVFRNRREMLVQGFRAEERYVRFGEEADLDNRPQDILIAPIHDDRQAVLAVVGVESNKNGVYSQTELRLLKTIMANVSTALTKARMYDEMEKLATIDGLTGIANHRKFQDVLTLEMERAKRYSTALTLLLMDIDHFKKFNDTYGHSVGDLVLKMVAKALQGAIRSTDFCARYGGEEFVVLLMQADEQQSRFLAERIRSAIETMTVKNENQVLQVTVSIGSATFPGDAATKQDLIDNSDKAMYYSKENGRNKVSFFSEVLVKEKST